MNIQAIRTAPRAPWQNAYVERVTGSVQRECLDHIIVVNAVGLHRILTDLLRNHLSRCGPAYQIDSAWRSDHPSERTDWRGRLTLW
jgi:hypothetical protein